MKFGRTAVLLIFVVAIPSYADAPGVYAITNGVVHPVSGPEIPRGTVVIRDGLIEAAGANVAIPADATVVDVNGAHVYPGLIDAHTSLGFTAPRRRGTSSPSGDEERVPERDAAFVAADEVEISEADLNARRAAGVTTVVTAPQGSIFNGQSVVLNLSEGEASSRVVRSPAAMNVAFRTRPAWTFPDSLMGVIAHMRQTFYDAQHYAAARAAYEKNPAQRRPATDASLEALGAVIRRDLPIVMSADTADMIGRARAVAREFNLRPIIAGARQGWRATTDLRDVPVLVAVNWPAAPANREDRDEQPLRVIRDRVNAPTTPSVLARAGVQFALVSGSGSASDFLRGIRTAIANGLTADDALRAVTLSPARIFGVERQLGSLERGKIANVIVTDRPLFERRAKVTRVFVDGRDVRLDPADETRESSPVNGTWNLSVRTPQGNVTVIVTLRVEQGHVSGTFSGDRGSGEITGGFYDRPSLQFTISAELDGETHDWVFRGDIDDDTIEGTVSTNLGTFQFSGSKSR